MTTDKGWMRLKAANGMFTFVGLAKIGKSHFVVSCDQGIFSYFTQGDSWRKLANRSYDDNVVFDHNSERLYVTRKKAMIIADTKTNEFQSFDSCYFANPQMIIAGSECHIFGSSQDNRHWIWNHQTQTAQFIDKRDEVSQPWIDGKYGLVYIASKQEILLLGGGERIHLHNFGISDRIRKYSLQTQKWQILNMRLPHRMGRFGCVLTKEQRYILIIGGNIYEKLYGNLCHYTSRSIFIFDLQKNEMFESSTRLPFCVEPICNAIIMEDKTQNQLLVHGFIKNKMKEFDLNIPFALVQIFEIWHAIEYVHVILNDALSKMHHWRINIDHIFSH